MIHQPLGGARVSNRYKDSRGTNNQDKKQIEQNLSERTGQPFEKIERDTERDFFMSAEEAKAYGIVDEVMERRK